MNLRDAIDQDVFNIDDSQYTDADFQAMSIDELETMRLRINKKISGISASIKEKQVEYASGGKMASKDWYLRRRAAMSINQRVLNYTNALLKKRRLRKNRTLSDYFMEQARRILPRSDFDRVLSKAHKEKRIREG